MLYTRFRGSPPVGRKRERSRSIDEVFSVGSDTDVLVMSDKNVNNTWFLENALYRSATPLWISNGVLHARSVTQPEVQQWNSKTREFLKIPLSGAPGKTSSLTPLQLSEGTRESRQYGCFNGRASAPNEHQLEEVAAVFKLPQLELTPGTRHELVVDWVGDVAQLRIKNKVIADKFWDGTLWRVLLEDHFTEEVTLHISPISGDMPIGLDEAAKEKLRRSPDPSCKIHSIKLIETSIWKASE